ncbi:hypothetical protein [Janthinobacterium sp. B9-8]|uniref:hypothetical protein n=1 Tax=Janthinobacterium sp. B9-8 TaxID=1236179 RepID=UPI00061D1A2A|nr:hypothetical protein [Janthinobacterium sp. B9-8]AMC33990.1 hypothetical protein VN23_04965 [Janthinobacterium sp. B9-8]
MRNFLTAIFSKDKSPFVNAKAATAWCKRLQEIDMQSQHLKIHAAVTAFVSEERPTTLDSLSALLLIDDAAQPSYEAVCYQYIANPRMSKDIESRLWKQITSFAVDMAGIYQRFVQSETESGKKAEFALLMPKVLARSLHYLSIQAKWHYFRFEKVPSKLWTLSHQLYRLSEIEGCDSNPFPLYTSHAQEVTSCADEYIQMLMLGSLSNNNLSVRQIDWVDQWLNQWSKLIQMSRKFQEGRYHLCVNLQAPEGVQKIQAESEGEPFRYWGLHDLMHELEETLRRLENGATPRDLGMGKECPAPLAVELLKHLDIFWLMSIRNSVVQRSERKKVAKIADIISGLDSIIGHVRLDNDKNVRKASADGRGQVDYDEIMDMRLYGFVSTRTKEKTTPNKIVENKQNDWHVWNIENESVGGYGAVVHLSENEWVRPGLLVANRLGRQENWHLGVIRRLNRLGDDEVYVGIQSLALSPIAVSLYMEKEERKEQISLAEDSTLGVADLPNIRTALYLPHQIDGKNVNTLILHSADYGTDKIYRVQARERVFMVRLGSVIEKGVDWIWVTVFVISQE